MSDETTFPETLHGILAVRRWVNEVVVSGPYSSVDELLHLADAAAKDLTPAEVDEALAGHPRIGEKHKGGGVAATFSSKEQQAPDADDEALAAAIAAGNRAYEERFGRVFLIRAAGRSRAEILAELTRRLDADDQSELLTVADELRQITLLRLRQTYGNELDIVRRTSVATEVDDAEKSDAELNREEALVEEPPTEGDRS